MKLNWSLVESVTNWKLSVSAFNKWEEIIPESNHGDVNSLGRLAAQRKTAARV